MQVPPHYVHEHHYDASKVATCDVIASQPWSRWLQSQSQLLLSAAGGDVMVGDIGNATTTSNDDTSIVSTVVTLSEWNKNNRNSRK